MRRSPRLQPTARRRVLRKWSRPIRRRLRNGLAVDTRLVVGHRRLARPSGVRWRRNARRITRILPKWRSESARWYRRASRRRRTQGSTVPVCAASACSAARSISTAAMPCRNRATSAERAKNQIIERCVSLPARAAHSVGGSFCWFMVYCRHSVTPRLNHSITLFPYASHRNQWLWPDRPQRV